MQYHKYNQTEILNTFVKETNNIHFLRILDAVAAKTSGNIILALTDSIILKSPDSINDLYEDYRLREKTPEANALILSIISNADATELNEIMSRYQDHLECMEYAHLLFTSRLRAKALGDLLFELGSVYRSNDSDKKIKDAIEGIVEYVQDNKRMLDSGRKTFTDRLYDYIIKIPINIIYKCIDNYKNNHNIQPDEDEN